MIKSYKAYWYNPYSDMIHDDSFGCSSDEEPYSYFERVYGDILSGCTNIKIYEITYVARPKPE